ncbi:MAG TPA: hypothetical protein VFS13_00700 [Steroidobacteraceae bacterium]|nr:hypothetical protein [Steroidobacteraceae bacterium]
MRSKDAELRDALQCLLYEQQHLKQIAAERDEAQRRYWQAQTRFKDASQRAAQCLAQQGGAVTYEEHRFERLGYYNVRITVADTELRIEQTPMPLQEARR